MPTILATALLSAFFLVAVTAVSVPSTATASVTKTAACRANLRTSPFTTANLRATIKTNTRVTVATRVTGGRWRVTCAGKTLSGKYWYRISAINGKSVKSLYGRTYLYAATGLFKPYVTPIMTTSSLKVVGLTPTVTATQFVAAVRDNTTDVIELAGGTYHPGLITLNVDRTRPLIIRPKAGASAVFAGGSGSAFHIGSGGVAGGITLEGLVFDGYSIGDTGIVWLGNCHDITVNDMVVRNSTGPAGYSWALYVSTNGGVSARNVVANHWTVDGGARTLGGLQIGNSSGPDNNGVSAHGWRVTNASYAIYSAAGAAGVDISDWTIDSSGLTTFADLSVVLVNTSGTIRNVHATNSGGPEIERPMVDAGGNTW